MEARHWRKFKTRSGPEYLLKRGGYTLLVSPSFCGKHLTQVTGPHGVCVCHRYEDSAKDAKRVAVAAYLKHSGK